jgi:exopolysaccharide biosynthesis polyprenyl glycosylphosphotransferase
MEYVRTRGFQGRTSNGAVEARPAMGSTLFSRTGVRSCEKLRLRLYISLLLIDLVVIGVAFGLGGALRLGDPFHDQTIRTLAIVQPTFMAISLNNGSYSLEALERPAASAGRAAEAFAYSIAAALMLLFTLKASEQFSRMIFAIGSTTSLMALVGARLAVGAQLGRKFRWRFASRLVIIDGVTFLPQRGDQVVFADELQITPDSSDPVLLDRLGTLVQNFDSVLIACAPERRRSWAHCLRGNAVQIEVQMPELAALDVVGLKVADGTRTLIVGAEPLSLRDRTLKRLLDIVVSIAALLFLMPLMCIIAIAIRIESPGPAIFRQQRLGQNNRLFSLFKFRSMRSESTDLLGATSACRHDARLTRIGRFIRRTSIDELPQLFNVLIGDMSIVGPRPHALGSTAEDAMFWEVEDRYFHRHIVKPGITGLAQVRGFRGSTEARRDVSNRLHSDLEYLNGWSIWHDIKIILNTFRVLVHPNAY